MDADTNQIVFYSNKLQFEIDSWDLYDALKRGDDMVILDARTIESFQQESIANSLSFPHRFITEERTKELSKNTLYVVYCDGIGCNASTSAALKLSRLGFKVKELAGGLKWWKDAGYPLQYGSEIDEKFVSSCGC